MRRQLLYIILGLAGLLSMTAGSNAAIASFGSSSDDEPTDVNARSLEIPFTGLPVSRSGRASGSFTPRIRLAKAPPAAGGSYAVDWIGDCLKGPGTFTHFYNPGTQTWDPGTQTWDPSTQTWDTVNKKYYNLSDSHYVPAVDPFGKDDIYNYYERGQDGYHHYYAYYNSDGYLAVVHSYTDYTDEYYDYKDTVYYERDPALHVKVGYSSWSNGEYGEYHDYGGYNYNGVYTHVHTYESDYNSTYNYSYTTDDDGHIIFRSGDVPYDILTTDHVSIDFLVMVLPPARGYWSSVYSWRYSNAFSNADVSGGFKAPDVVGNLQIDQRWVFAQHMGANFGMTESFYNFYSVPATTLWGNNPGSVFGAHSTTGNSYFNGGFYAPDVVVNMRIDQPWGLAQLMGPLHDQKGAATPNASSSESDQPAQLKFKAENPTIDGGSAAAPAGDAKKNRGSLGRGGGDPSGTAQVGRAGVKIKLFASNIDVTLPVKGGARPRSDIGHDLGSGQCVTDKTGACTINILAAERPYYGLSGGSSNYSLAVAVPIYSSMTWAADGASPTSPVAIKEHLPSLPDDTRVKAREFSIGDKKFVQVTIETTKLNLSPDRWKDWVKPAGDATKNRGGRGGGNLLGTAQWDPCNIKLPAALVDGQVETISLTHDELPGTTVHLAHKAGGRR